MSGSLVNNLSTWGTVLRVLEIQRVIYLSRWAAESKVADVPNIQYEMNAAHCAGVKESEIFLVT